MVAHRYYNAKVFIRNYIINSLLSKRQSWGSFLKEIFLMNEFVQMSPQINELASSLAKAQGELKPVHKSAENPYFKSKYADLSAIVESIRPVLSKYSLALMQLPSGGGENRISVTTILTHSSGQWISGSCTLYAKDATPQAIGSAITYARRYSLSAILSIATDEDDDGNTASRSSNGGGSRAYNAPVYTAESPHEEIGSHAAPTTKEYRIPFGKFKYKTLKELKSEEIESYIRYLMTTSEKGKPMGEQAKEFIENARRYLSRPAESSEVSKAGDEPPPFSDEDIPF
jgi:hypothetical protein